MSDYAFFTGVTGVQWTVLTLPSQGDPQVSLDDDGTVSVSGDFHASVSYSYPDPVTGAAVPHRRRAWLLQRHGLPHQFPPVRHLAVTGTTPGQVTQRSGRRSSSAVVTPSWVYALRRAQL